MIGGRPVIYGLGNFVWNTPGSGFAKHDAPPFGLVVDLVLDAGDGFTLRVHPILTDNSVTEFRNRPADAREFPQAASALFPDQPRIAPAGSTGRLHVELVCRSGETWIPQAGAKERSAG